MLQKKFYLDTAIWIDFYEDRKGYYNEPIGLFAFQLLALIKSKNHKIAISDLSLRELETKYSREQVVGIIRPFENIIEKVTVSKEEKEEAKKIAKERNLPRGDVLHAIIARDNDLILITRDNHFRKICDISKHYKPEEII